MPHELSPTEREWAIRGITVHARVPRTAPDRPWSLTDFTDADLYLLAVLIARSNLLARTERQLAAEIPDAPARFTRPSLLFAYTLLAFTVTCLAAVCGLFGRILL